MTTAAPRADGVLTLDEAARRLGVHYMTVYRYVRLGRLPAERHGGRWWVRPEDVDRAASAPEGGRRGPGSRQWGHARQYLMSRLVVGDPVGAWAVVEHSLAGGATPTDVYVELLGPALRRIGERWAAGELGIDLEHRATAVALRIVGRLGPLFVRRGPPVGGTVVLSGAPGDPHLIPVAMVADVLRSTGRRVVELGADAPHRSVLDAVGAVADLHAVGLSLSADAHAASLRRLTTALRRAHPTVPIIVGGPAVPSLPAARALGADGWAADAAGAALLLGGGVPVPPPPTWSSGGSLA